MIKIINKQSMMSVLEEMIHNFLIVTVHDIIIIDDALLGNNCTETSIHARYKNVKL